MPPAVSERPTRITVDLDNLSHNLRAIRAHVGVPVMGIVKANAYGHGLVPVALHLQAQGVEQLGVAFVEEGIALRRAGMNGVTLIVAPSTGAPTKNAPVAEVGLATRSRRGSGNVERQR